MIATLPYLYNDEGVPSGLRQPSNIFKGQDGYYYVYSSLSDYPNGDQWICVMRTDDLSDPQSWRYWVSGEFTGEFIDPYTEEEDPAAPLCSPLERRNLNGAESITYNTVLDKYVLMGTGEDPNGTPENPRFGVYYSLSDDLLNWSMRKLLIELPPPVAVEDPDNDLYYAYPVFLDPDSPSLNFDTLDGHFYLYIARLNHGGLSLDRDLIRYPVQIETPFYQAPVWAFEGEGDAEGWQAENGLADFSVAEGVLTMTSSSDDPYMRTSLAGFSAEIFQKLAITMRVSGGDATRGEIYFATESDNALGEDKYLAFEVIADGEFHTYVLDMSSVSGWQGVITQLRIDPVVTAGLNIEIDQIAISE